MDGQTASAKVVDTQTLVNGKMLELGMNVDANLSCFKEGHLLQRKKKTAFGFRKNSPNESSLERERKRESCPPNC